MKRFTCCFVSAIVLCAINVNVDAYDERYRINVTEDYNPWFNSSTYDIKIRRYGPLIDIGEPVESRLRDVPIGGQLHRLFAEADKNRRINAETDLIKAQTELLRFQLEQLKLKQQRQRRQVRNVESVDESWAISKPSSHPLSQPKSVVRTAKTAKVTKAHVERGKRKLARVLKLNDAETRHLYRRINHYESKYDTDTKTAAFMYLIYDRKMKSARASNTVDRLNYYFR